MTCANRWIKLCSVVIVLEDKVYIANLKTMDILETLETAPNPRGLAVLSNMENGHLVFPSGSTPGELMFYDTMNLSVLNAVQVHKSNVVAMALNDDASLLATASDTVRCRFCVDCITSNAFVGNSDSSAYSSSWEANICVS